MQRLKIQNLNSQADMTNEERLQANADKGYILVAAFDGWEIYKKQNEVGGWTYYSDRISNEGAYPIWDTVTGSTEELIALVNDLAAEIEKQINRETELWKAFGKFCNAIRTKLKDE